MGITESRQGGRTHLAPRKLLQPRKLVFQCRFDHLLRQQYLLHSQMCPLGDDKQCLLHLHQLELLEKFQWPPAEPVRAAPAEPVEVAAAPAEAVEVAAAPAEAVEVAAELVEVAAADDYEEPAVPAAEAAPLSPPPADEHEEMDPWQRRFLRLNLQARLGQAAGDDANSDTRSSTTEQEVAETELPLPPNRDDTPTVSSVLSDEFTPRQEEEPEWLELESAMVRRAAQEFLGFLLGVYIFVFLLLVLPT